MLNIHHICNGHRWALISEEKRIDGIKQVFKCIDCLYTYERFIPRKRGESCPH